MKRTSHPQQGFAHIVVVLIMLVAIGGLAFVAIRRVKSNNGGALAGCSGNQKVSMTHEPMDMSDVKSVAPMGLTAGAHVTPIDHLYFYPKSDQRDAAPVYAMADGFITSIEVRGVNVSSGEKRPPEYRLEMQHSCRTTSYFDLITKLDDSILAKAPDAATKGYSGKIAIKSGQVIGHIGAQSLDTAIYDNTKTLPGFIHPEMYKAEPWKVHTDDFFSYFPASQQAEMLAKNNRKVEPRSGKIDYDQPGKLIGNWFKEGTNGYAGPKNTQVGDGSGRGYWSGHLAIFYDAYDPTKITISIGEFKNGQPQAFAVKGNTPDPAKVDATSGVIKYELVTTSSGVGQNSYQMDNRVMGVVLVQVLPGEKIKFQVFPDATTAQVSGFTNPVTYER